MSAPELTEHRAGVAPVPVPRAVAIGWIVAAIAAALLVPVGLDAAVPVLTIVSLLVAAVILRRARSPAALGLVVVHARRLAAVTLVATAAMTALFAVAELVFHPYRELLVLIRVESRPDSTFTWILEDGTVWGLIGFVVYAALVTMFAEELLFRGAILNAVRSHGEAWAVAVSTVAFAALQAIPTLLLPTQPASASSRSTRSPRSASSAGSPRTGPARSGRV